MSTLKVNNIIASTGETVTITGLDIGSGASLSGSFSGSFEGDGTLLTGVASPTGSYTGSFTGSMLIDDASGSFSGSFEGDGSGLTGVAPVAGTGVTVIGTTVSIGQDVSTTSSVSFNEILATTVTAATGTFVYQIFESSSTIITSGSNIFGNDANDIQQITGSLLHSGSSVTTGSAVITGSLNVVGDLLVDGAPLSVNPFPYTGSAEISGSLTVVGTITETSARRYKENIFSLENQLNNVTQLNPVEYNWINGGSHDIGLIAEEVNEIYPDLVQKKGDEIVGIQYSRLTSVLISAIKELTSRVVELENK